MPSNADEGKPSDGRAPTIADLKASVDITDIVGRYVPLKRGLGVPAACCPFHKEKTPSFKVDRRRQRFHCFGCGAHGDVLDFLAAIEGLDKVGSIKRLREIVGSSDSYRPARPPRPPASDEPDPEAELKRELAQETWRQTGDVRPGTEPHVYLTERRGISRWDAERVRWHGACPWGTGTAGCIVVPISDPATGRVSAIWRIRPRLSGKVERWGLAPMKGGAARLFPAPGPRLVIAEGVEDALAAHELTGLPAWAALSAGNMAGLALPERFREVLILADRDENGVGQENAHKLASRLRAEGRHAIVRLPIDAKDANDVLRRRAS